MHPTDTRALENATLLSCSQRQQDEIRYAARSLSPLEHNVVRKIVVGVRRAFSLTRGHGNRGHAGEYGSEAMCVHYERVSIEG
jgi:hypothetical protein